MACTSPIRGVRYADGRVRPVRGVADSRLHGAKVWGNLAELELPCGRCGDCRVRKTTDWTTRLEHEATQHERAAFLTLTFSDEGLALRELQHGTHPFDLDMGDWQRFAKRLRKHIKTFRYFQVGEYGDQSKRPHYHALMFGEDFKIGTSAEWKTKEGFPRWTHPTIEKCWPYGFHEIGQVLPETIRYVARYVQKKRFGTELQNSLQRTDLLTGEFVGVRPELASMSRRPGIGSNWFKNYKHEVFPDDFVILDGKKKPVPRYYVNLLKRDDEAAAARLTEARAKKSQKRAPDNVPERRAARAQVTRAKIRGQGKRKL